MEAQQEYWQKFQLYREQVRRVFESMSDQALRRQDMEVRGGIDREELDREMQRRGIWS